MIASFKELLSPEYLEFNKSREVYRKLLTKFLRVGLSLFLIAFAALRYYFDSPNIIDYAIIPVVFILNITVSTLVLRKKYESFNVEYQCIIVLSLFSSSLEIAIMVSSNCFMTLFYGIEIGLLIMIGLYSKMPFSRYFLNYIMLYAHVMLRIYLTSPSLPIFTTFVFTIIVLMLCTIYSRQEIFEFQIWKSLRSSHRSLQSFQQLIHVFPSKILVFSKNTKMGLLYTNEEINRYMVKEGCSNSIDSFLKSFALDPNTEASESLHELLHNMRERAQEGFPFQCYYSTFKSHYRRNSELIFSSKSKDNTDDEDERRETRRFEIKIGSISWEEEEDSAVIVILNDISKSERIRELKLLHEHKDKLLATVSHELRTPLNGIIGMLDVMESRLKNTEGVQKYLEIARNSSKYLLLMINDILDISQIERGTLRLTLDYFKIHDLIKQVLPLIKVQTRQKGLKLIYQNFAVGASACVDRVRFQQIMLNLLSNAVKFTDSGFIKVRVTVRERSQTTFGKLIDIRDEKMAVCDEESCPMIPIEKESLLSELDCMGEVEVGVEDSGIGIPESKIPHLFKLFSKLENKGNSTGVGLGLAISQKLAQQMQFTPIRVYSIVGKGSRFWFNIKSNFNQRGNLIDSDVGTPCEEISCNTLEATEVDKELNICFEKVSNRRRKILIVDDDQINHIVIKEYLRDFPDCDYHQAFNGREAITIFQEKASKDHFFDIILMDCNMPVMDGFEATESIIKAIEDKGLPKTIIVALTANISASDKEQCYKFGMREVWTKPIQKDDFFEGMKHLLGLLK